jgi:O-antigen ligase
MTLGASAVRRVPLGGALLAALLALAALLVGSLSALNPFFAAALVLAVAVALIVAADIRWLPVFLVFTMFVESLSLGPGLRVGRLAGAMALAALAYYLLVRGRADLKPNALLGLSGAFGFWLLLSSYWANVPSAVYTLFFSYLLALAYMLSFAILVRTKEQLVAIFATLAFGSLVFGLVSFATYQSAGPGTRGAGLQGDPNYFAVYQVVALSATLVLAARENRPQRRLVYYGVIGVIVLSVMSSLSRTGLIALVVVMLASILLPWRIFFRRPGQKLSYLLALAVASTAAVIAGSSQFVARAQTILDPSRAGDRGSGRTDLWRAALTGWHEDPWLGMGSGNFSARSLDLLTSTPGVNTTANYVRAGREVHSAYIGTLAELGVPGFLMFVGLILLTGWYFVRSFRRAQKAGDLALERFSLALLLSLMGYAISAFFLSNELGKLLWILVGLALALDVMTRRLAPAPAPGGPVRAPQYDPAVSEAVEQLERRLQQRLDALLAEQERLSRRSASLAAREQELQDRLRALDERTRSLGEADPELRARELAEAREVVTATAQRLQRQLDALTERERELAEREEKVSDLEQRPPEDRSGEAARLHERERRLEARVEELTTREKELKAAQTELSAARRAVESRAPTIAERERKLAALEEQLNSKADAIEEAKSLVQERELALAKRAGKLAAREETAKKPEPEPQPEPAPVVPETVPAGDRGIWTLAKLEHLVEERAAEFPERVDEWRSYIFFLRDHADVDGGLPASFDYLVEEVFEPLL